MNKLVCCLGYHSKPISAIEEYLPTQKTHELTDLTKRWRNPKTNEDIIFHQTKNLLDGRTELWVEASWLENGNLPSGETEEPATPKKYEFTGEKKTVCLPGDYHFLTGLKPGKSYINLRRIKRISDGLIGGWIEKEENLSHEGRCFVYDEATVCGDAYLSGNTCLYGKRSLTSVIESDDLAKMELFEKMADEAKMNEVKVVRTETYTITKNGQTMSLTRDEIEKVLKQ